MPRTDFWSEDEVATLRRMAVEGSTDPEIAFAVDRSPEAVATKRKRLGLTSIKPNNWSKAEIELMTANAHQSMDVLVKLFPNRTRSGVITKRDQIRSWLRAQGVPKPEPVAEEDAPRPLWVPFVTASGVKAIRTEAGVVPFVSLLHSGHDASSLPA